MQGYPQKRRGGPSTNETVLRPGMLPTPDTSFSGVSGEIEHFPALATKSFTEHVDQPFTSRVEQAMKNQGLLSPETSFSVPNDENEVPVSPSPTLE